MLSLSLAVAFLPFSISFCHIALIFFLITSLPWQKSILSIRSFRDNALVILLVSFVIIHLAGMLYTENIAYGWVQLEKKIFLFLIPLAIAFSTSIRRKEVIIIFFVFITTCLLASLYCIIHSFHEIQLLKNGILTLEDFNYLSSTPYKSLNPDASDNWMLLSYRSLASGIKMHPTYLSLYLVFCIMIIIQSLHIIKVKSSMGIFIAITLIVYFSLFTVFLSSRIIIIGLIALLIFSVFRSPAIQTMWRKAAYAFLIVSGIIFLIYANPITRYRCYQEFQTSSLHIHQNKIYETSTEIRASLWWLGLKSIQNVNWVWGSGTGDSEDIMKETSNTYNVKNILRSDNPHNQFLCTVLQHGILGMVVLTALLTIPMKSAWSKKEYLVFTFCSLIILTCLTEPVLERQKGIDFLAVFYPLLLFHHHSKNGTSHERKRPSEAKHYQDASLL